LVLAMIANENVLVGQGNEVARESHLVDMRSRSGFSGSPVFVYRIQAADLSQPPPPLDHRGLFTQYPPVTEAIKNNFMALLGIHCGQIWEETESQQKSASITRATR
jgi:hypothetical protein